MFSPGDSWTGLAPSLVFLPFPVVFALCSATSCILKKITFSWDVLCCMLCPISGRFIADIGCLFLCFVHFQRYFALWTWLV
jgi:hypothetical protein